MLCKLARHGLYLRHSVLERDSWPCMAVPKTPKQTPVQKVWIFATFELQDYDMQAYDWEIQKVFDYKPSDEEIRTSKRFRMQEVEVTSKEGIPTNG